MLPEQQPRQGEVPRTLEVYKHLGAKVAFSGQMMAEVVAKDTASRPHMHTLKRFAKRHVDIQAETLAKLADLRVFSKMFCGAGAWAPLNASCMKVLDAAVRRIYLVDHGFIMAKIFSFHLSPERSGQLVKVFA